MHCADPGDWRAPVGAFFTTTETPSCPAAPSAGLTETAPQQEPATACTVLTPAKASVDQMQSVESSTTTLSVLAWPATLAILSLPVGYTTFPNGLN